LQPDFDLDRYIGRWFEFQRRKDLPFQSGDCGYVEYTLKDPYAIRVFNTEYREEISSYNSALG
jgi:lipocalin